MLRYPSRAHLQQQPSRLRVLLGPGRLNDMLQVNPRSRRRDPQVIAFAAVRAMSERARILV